jgi:cell division protein FtsL
MKMEHQITFGERMLNTLLTVTVVVLIGILVSVVIAVGLEAVGFF